MAFKIADGYVEVHARHDRNQTRRSAQQAVNDADKVGKANEGSLLSWLFKSNPKLMRMIEAPIGHIFGSPIVATAAAGLAAMLVGLISTALVTALLSGIGLGFIGIGALVNKENKKLKDSFIGMKSDIKGVFERASEPIIGPLSKAMDMIGAGFKRMEPSFNRIYKALAPIIEPFTGGLVGFLEAMLPGIERALPGIQTVFLALADHLPGLGTSIGDFFATIAENGPLLARVVGLMITWLDNFFKVAGPILVFWMEGFAFWSDRWNDLTHAIGAGVEWIGKTWQKIPGWWDSTWGAVAGWFSDVGASIGGFFSDLWNTITNWWDNTTSSIAGWWDRTWGAITRWFSELPMNIWNFIQGIPDMIGDLFMRAFDMAFYLVGYYLGMIVASILSFVTNVPIFFQNAWDTVTGAMEAAWTWALVFVTQTLVELGQNVWGFITGIDDFFVKMAASVILTISGWVHSLVTWFGNLRGSMVDRIRNAWEAVIGWFTWGFREGPTITAKLVQQVVSRVVSLGTSLYNAGQDAIRGLVNGIGSMMSWAVDMAWRAALRIRDGFLDALKIGSPSKVMADEVGKWIPKGIVVGVEDNMGDLEKLARHMPDMFTGARAPLGGGAAATSTDQSTNYGNITMHINVENIQELADIQAFLNGKLQGSTKGNVWAGNIYEATGQYERGYR